MSNALTYTKYCQSKSDSNFPTQTQDPTVWFFTLTGPLTEEGLTKTTLAQRKAGFSSETLLESEIEQKITGISDNKKTPKIVLDLSGVTEIDHYSAQIIRSLVKFAAGKRDGHVLITNALPQVEKELIGADEDKPGIPYPWAKSAEMDRDQAYEYFNPINIENVNKHALAKILFHELNTVARSRRAAGIKEREQLNIYNCFSAAVAMLCSASGRLLVPVHDLSYEERSCLDLSDDKIRKPWLFDRWTKPGQLKDIVEKQRARSFLFFPQVCNFALGAVSNLSATVNRFCGNNPGPSP